MRKISSYFNQILFTLISFKMKRNILDIPEDILKHFREQYCLTQQELATFISMYFPESGSYNKQEVDRAEHGKYNVDLLLFIIDRILRNNIVSDIKVYQAARKLGSILGTKYYETRNPIKGKEILNLQHTDDFVKKLKDVIVDLSLRDREELEMPLSIISLDMEIRVDSGHPNLAAKACIYFLDEYIFALSSIKRGDFPKFEYIDVLDKSKKSLIEKYLMSIGIQMIGEKSTSEMLEIESKRLSEINLQRGNYKLMKDSVLSKYITKINQILKYQSILESELDYKPDENTLIFGKDVIKEIYIKNH